MGEDVVFQFAAYALARKTVVMPDKFYHYVMESESATHEFNSAEARAKKLDAHMRMLEEVLEDWAAYGLLDLCPGELITWFLDLIVFDLARLDADDFHRVAARVNMDLTTFWERSGRICLLRAPFAVLPASSLRRPRAFRWQTPRCSIFRLAVSKPAWSALSNSKRCRPPQLGC